MSSAFSTSFAPCLIRVFGVQDPLLVTLPGTANTSLFCSTAQRAVMRVPEFSLAHPVDEPPRLAISALTGAGLPELRAHLKGFPGVGEKRLLRGEGR